VWPAYGSAPESGALRQGEILSEVWEHRPELPAAEALTITTHAEHRSARHALVVILTQDCDLEQDYTARFHSGDFAPDTEETHPKLLPHILLTDLLTEAELRSRLPGSDILKRAKTNADERYHQLAPAFFDFKKVFGIPTGNLYKAVHSGAVRRVAQVAPIYLHDLIHRFFAFQSRVALPE